MSLISAFSGEWQPKKYKDTYTAGLRKVVRAKVQGKKVHHAVEHEGGGAARPDGGAARLAGADGRQLASEIEAGRGAQDDCQAQGHEYIAALKWG